MKQTTLIVLFALISLTGCAQSIIEKNKASQKIVGGNCEGCEAIYESPVAFEKLPNTVTLPDYTEKGPKIEISGIVYQRDGKTPAKDVIIYIYHTDQTGRYSKKGNETGWGQRHGYIRGWMKTNEKGEYKFYTLRPAAYPNRKDPQHIHVTIKESDKNGYSVDTFLFEDDPLLTKEQRDKERNIGGDGIVRLKAENGVWKATRNIILGLNVQDYPVK
jgi:protocatechuate 3,4-dioxygenase, beta subunit